MAVKRPVKSQGDDAETQPVRRVVRRRKRRIEAILAEAATELAERGYWEFSLEAVADRLDLSKPSLYHYFPSRDELVAAALKGVAAEAMARLETSATQPGLGYRARLRALISEQLAFLLSNPAATALFARPRDWPAVHRDLVSTLVRDHNRLFRRVVQEAVEAGEIHPVSVRTAILCMHGAINGVAAGYQGSRNGTAVSSFIEEVADIVLAMFNGPRGTGAKR